MESNGDVCSSPNLSHPEMERLTGQASALSSNVFLDRVGEVCLSLNSDGLSWTLHDSLENVDVLGLFSVGFSCLLFS